MGRPNLPPKIRFENLFIPEPNSGCWLWLGKCLPTGYGIFRAGIEDSYKAKYAHRISWEFYRGPIPMGLYVCHKCDIPTCVNPYHLFLGTAGDNARDREAKGRGGKDPHRKGRPVLALSGELSYAAKLTDSAVRLIRASATSHKDVAAEYGVSESAIRQVRARQTWKHIL